MNEGNTLIEISQEAKYKLKAITSLRRLKGYNETIDYLIQKDPEVYNYLQKISNDGLNENNNAQ